MSHEYGFDLSVGRWRLYVPNSGPGYKFDAMSNIRTVLEYRPQYGSQVVQVDGVDAINFNEEDLADLAYVIRRWQERLRHDLVPERKYEAGL